MKKNEVNVGTGWALQLGGRGGGAGGAGSPLRGVGGTVPEGFEVLHFNDL